MKKFLLLAFSINLIFILFVFNLYAAEKKLDYGFEDWTGDANTTPGYIISASTLEYWNSHLRDSEVVNSYNPTGYPLWTPHSGRFFLLRSDANGLSPSVPGITASDVNDHFNIGYKGAYGGGNNFDLDQDIKTGELFIRFYARIVGFSSASGNCKWIRVYGTNFSDTTHTVYMHLTFDRKLGLYINGSFRAFSGVKSDLDDGNWHKYSLLIDYNNQKVYGWYDVDQETLDNYSVYYSGSLGQGNVGPGETFVIQGNFSASTPSQQAFHALDDIEVWNGLPDSKVGVTPTPPTGLVIISNN